jgi:S1-C subfamily serine protease
VTERVGLRALAALLAAALGAALAGCSAIPQGPDPLPSSWVPDAVTSSSPGTDDLVGGFTALEREALRVRVRTCDIYGTGTAFAIDATHAVTNRHVAEGATDVSLNGYDGATYTVTKVVLSRTDDLALLTIKGEFPNVVTLADDEPEVGDRLTIAGYPHGEELTVTEGQYIQSVPDTLEHMKSLVYQIGAESHPGNSGSAVANADGEVVGVLYASNDINTSYAVPLPVLKNFLAHLGKAKKNSADCDSQG